MLRLIAAVLAMPITFSLGHFVKQPFSLASPRRNGSASHKSARARDGTAAAGAAAGSGAGSAAMTKTTGLIADFLGQILL